MRSQAMTIVSVDFGHDQHEKVASCFNPVLKKRPSTTPKYGSDLGPSLGRGTGADDDEEDEEAS